MLTVLPGLIVLGALNEMETRLVASIELEEE